MSEYEKNLKKDFAQKIKNLHSMRKKVKSSLGAEEIYKGMEESIDDSLFKYTAQSRDRESLEEIIDTVKQRKPRSGGRAFSNPITSPAHSKTGKEVLKTINVDKDRRIDVLYDALSDEVEIQANALSKNQLNQSDFFNIEGKYEKVPPRIQEETLTSLKMDKDGKVKYLKSSLRGAKERSTERVLMEAQKMGLPPKDTNLSSASRKMIARKGLEMEDDPEGVMKQIKRFLSKGKTGKLWKAAPFIGPAIGAGALATGAAEAQDFIPVLGEADPIGDQSPERMAVEEPASPEFIKERLRRELMKRRLMNASQ